MTTTNQKISLNNCTHEQIFKASRIQTKAAATFVKDEKRIGHSMKHMTAMAEHYVITANDNFRTTKHGHPKFDNFLPSELGATKDYWEEKGIPHGRLLVATYTCPHTGSRTQVHQTMNGVPVDTRSDEFQTMYQNFIAYPSSIILETQAELDKIISEELKNDIRSERHELGPCYALERLQRALIIMQNKLWSKRVQINRELSDIIAKPLRSNRQVMELSERLDALLGMKERANGVYCRTYDYDTAISIVNSQTESETAAPYATEQSHLDLSRLLSDMDREIELGNNINLTNLLTRLGNVFPPEQAQPDDATLHQALFAATMRTSQRDIPRRSEPKDQPNDAESTRTGKAKRRYDYEQGEPEPWERVLRAVNDLKSEVGGFRKLLVEHGIMHDDPPRRPTQPRAAGKENVKEQRSKGQRPEKFAGTAGKGKGKGKDKSGHAPSYLPLRQELQSDSGSEDGYASMAVVQSRPQIRVDYRAMNAHCRKDTRKGDWTKTQPANGIEVRTSALASMCLADDDLTGSQLCPGMPASPPQDRMTTNPLSLYASFLGFQAQQAESGYDEAIISALRETLDDQPMEEEEAIPSPSPVVPAPTLTVGTDNETSVPKTSPLPKRQTRSESRIASYVIPSILEPPRADDSEPEESLTGPIAAQDRAASSLAKGPASKGPPKTADRRRGQPSVAECGHTSVHAPGVAGNPRIQWDVIEDEELSAVPRLTPKAIGPPSLRRGGPCAN